MTKYDYTVIGSSDLSIFEDLVIEALEAGYNLVGGMSVSGDGEENYSYMQPMIGMSDGRTLFNKAIRRNRWFLY